MPALADVTRKAVGHDRIVSIVEALLLATVAVLAAWSAYIDGNQEGMTPAEKRLRSEFKVAFDAWIATDPTNNSEAPSGPTYMPE